MKDLSLPYKCTLKPREVMEDVPKEVIFSICYIGREEVWENITNNNTEEYK